MASTGKRKYPSKPIGEATTLEVITNHEFVSVVVSWAIGFLLTLNVLLHLPDLAAFF
jgi:hypothetical protein